MQSISEQTGVYQWGLRGLPEAVHHDKHLYYLCNLLCFALLYAFLNSSRASYCNIFCYSCSVSFNVREERHPNWALGSVCFYADVDRVSQSFMDLRCTLPLHLWMSDVASNITFTSTFVNDSHLWNKSHAQSGCIVQSWQPLGWLVNVY